MYVVELQDGKVIIKYFAFNCYYKWDIMLHF